MSKYEYLKPFQKRKGCAYKLFDAEGVDRYGELNPSSLIMRLAVEQGQAIRYNTETERFYRVPGDKYIKTPVSAPADEHNAGEEDGESHENIVTFLHERAQEYKPEELFMDELTWKYLIRNVIRSRNTMIVGPTGSGKTKTVQWVAEALNRPLYKFNLGATQDPRGALIGNTHFSKDKGTYFNESPFITAIQTPNAIVLLDELSRANLEAFNILMTALDDGQRYIRLDEHADAPIIEVHPTVTFMATANIGVEYSSTRVIDRAVKDRFVPIEMKYLSEDDEYELLTKLFPDVSDHNRLMVAKAVTKVREDVNSLDGQLEHNLSTRHSVDMASLINDGFTIHEALELVVWPQYDSDGGMESDQTHVKQLLQSVIVEEPEPLEDGDEEVEMEDDDNFQSFPKFQ